MITFIYFVDMIIHLCLNFKRGLDKLPMELEMVE